MVTKDLKRFKNELKYKLDYRLLQELSYPKTPKQSKLKRSTWVFLKGLQEASEMWSSTSGFCTKKTDEEWIKPEQTPICARYNMMGESKCGVCKGKPSLADFLQQAVKVGQSVEHNWISMHLSTRCINKDLLENKFLRSKVEWFFSWLIS